MTQLNANDNNLIPVNHIEIALVAQQTCTTNTHTQHCVVNGIIEEWRFEFVLTSIITLESNELFQ